jgi:hypothetical protein
MRLLVAVILAVMSATAAGCSAPDVASTDIEDISSNEFSSLTSTGLVVGRLGPGTPPRNEVPAEVTLVFQQGENRVEVVSANGQYRVELPPGTWQVRSTDELTCASGIEATVAALRRYDLVYPLQACADLSGPPDSAPQPPPPDAPK